MPKVSANNHPSQPVILPSPDSMAAAGRHIAAGGLVAFPTETVYGLGADATNPRAIAAIFAAKQRPLFNPLIVHVPDLTSAERYGMFNTNARALAEAFWPGPLTLIVPLQPSSGICDLVTAGLPTIALRVPSHTIARDLLNAAQCPIAAPSANRSGHVSATSAAHVVDDLSGDPSAALMVLDGGDATHGVESTIVRATDDAIAILRPGSITPEQISSVVGHNVERITAAAETPQSPGQLASHYATRACIRLNATDVGNTEALLTFGAVALTSKVATFHLSTSGDLVEAAANLYASLRQLDASGAETIAVTAIPDVGLGIAINDRLRRAAAPRPKAAG